MEANGDTTSMTIWVGMQWLIYAHTMQPMMTGSYNHLTICGHGSQKVGMIMTVEVSNGKLEPMLKVWEKVYRQTDLQLSSQPDLHKSTQMRPSTDSPICNGHYGYMNG